MPIVHYISTRGQTPPMSFEDAALEGLAPDGGLLVPDRIPDVRDQLSFWAQLSYPDLALEVFRRFADLPQEVLKHLVARAYRTFSSPEVTPVVRVGPLWVLELFHGPTLAFKDVALQFLGAFFDYALEKRNARLNILGATSGDTGSAAIHGVRGQSRVHIFIMHPRGRVSPAQERQMTSVLDPNVFNLAVDGTFDDCQNLMKSIFRDVDFKRRYSLGSINSVNWARIVAQIVYYFYAGLRVIAQTGAPQVAFAVPTGNFGDILAGWYAARMGLPVRRLILATNENDILTRFFNTGEYSLGQVVPTLSPSMDIQVASNFERYLYYRLGEDAEAVRRMMDQFGRTGRLRVEGSDPLFRAGVGGTEEVLETIRRFFGAHGYLLDPHTAVGVSVAEEHLEDGVPVICLATAHPAKFANAIERALGRNVARHPAIDALEGAPTRVYPIANDERAVRAFVAEHAAV
ncbi:MAG: threonine synthase [Kiritimatiellae bacterium]|nr:threonine synthase [Kiritimatiellia bacterium]MDW8457750.1 threonine synthase [Verrucomicrobiota bacterium]